jgi:hypothetical protein
MIWEPKKPPKPANRIKSPTARENNPRKLNRNHNLRNLRNSPLNLSQPIYHNSRKSLSSAYIVRRKNEKGIEKRKLSS